jgi:ribosomal protein L36
LYFGAKVTAQLDPLFDAKNPTSMKLRRSLKSRCTYDRGDGFAWQVSSTGIKNRLEGLEMIRRNRIVKCT